MKKYKKSFLIFILKKLRYEFRRIKKDFFTIPFFISDNPLWITIIISICYQNISSYIFNVKSLDK